MRKIGSALALLIVGLFLVSFIAVPANAVTTPTTSWEVGDKWAMGKQMDIGATFDDSKDELESMIEGYLNFTVNKLEVDGSACFYVLFEVTSETTTTPSALTRAIPCTTGKSRVLIEEKSSAPSPLRANTFSITIVPPSR